MIAKLLYPQGVHLAVSANNYPLLFFNWKKGKFKFNGCIWWNPLLMQKRLKNEKIVELLESRQIWI